jgi:CheY-like chemotaxis protein
VNGLEGLLTAYEMRPDVIVMDLTMPVLNGLEAHNPVYSIPVVWIPARAM